MNSLTIIIVVLLLPGAIGSIIFEKITVSKKWNSFKFILNSVLISLLSYLALQGIFNLLSNWCIEARELRIWNVINMESIPYQEVFYATIIGIFFGFIISLIDNRLYLYRFAKLIRFSDLTSDENIFSFFLKDNIKFIHFRDLENDLVYSGRLQFYKETDEFKELVLEDVSVYRNTSEGELYKLDKIYISRPKDNIIFEVPIINENENG